MSDTDFCSCDELDLLLRRDAKHMEYKGKVISCLLLDKMEAFDTIFKGTLHVIRTIHHMGCWQHHCGCDQHGARRLIVCVVCLCRSQARRPNGRYLHTSTQSPMK